MRLICPNCDAEYQVDDAAIPETGRDVQCSNCGHAWFQLPADAEGARAAEDDVFGVDAGDAAQSGEHDDVHDGVHDRAAEPDMERSDAAPPAAPLPDAPSRTAPITDTPTPDPDLAAAMPENLPAVAPDEAARPVAGRQSLAESVLSVLREEAARETAVRREEGPPPRAVDAAGSMETQTEFGLEPATPPVGETSAAARHIARLKGNEPELAPKAAARRDLLPDIEEINSTLRADTDRSDPDYDPVDDLPDLHPRRRGFRSGFVLVMIIAVVLAMTYVMAPRIIAQIPGSAPAMRAYVASVDSGRLWLDGMMKTASGSLRNFSGDGN